MGGCVGSHHDSSGSLNENSDGTGVALGRNQPLKRERPKWKSDYPMTEGQLRSKRDEFWDTAPAFEGRKEIWDALRAAASAFESSDHMLAQAILDGASITLPHGRPLTDRLRLDPLNISRDYVVQVIISQPPPPLSTPPRALLECYDELGNRYQLPVYCLSPPVNMIEEHSDEPDGSDPDSGMADPSGVAAATGGECLLRLRLSTGRDLRLAVRSVDTVGAMKRRLQSQEGVAPATQRWFFSGRPLTDRLRLDQLNISRDYVVQVIISQPPLALSTPPLGRVQAGGEGQCAGPVDDCRPAGPVPVDY
ncbi:Ubiquitin domain-containing protein 2 [Merluccius polli]|uniref:Ubiquitin domain-containing protein 2 n=1 Tax=Merluccius polli TaxID=89951 RepID=A0AA47P3G1_MERPO|nr:Ubiquitin domain-containing protein 2 [Merluccius polli]